MTFDLLRNRDRWVGPEGQLTDELRDFLRASKIRVTLRGHPYTRNARHTYHGLYEIKVNGT